MSEENGSVEAGNPEGAPAPEGQAPAPTDGFLSTIENTELKGWAENKGFPGIEEALNSYHNLEKTFGADKAGRTVTLLGDDPAPEAFSEFYNKLGRPEKAEGYSFAAPEGADDTFANAAKEMFHGAGVTEAQASKIVDWYEGQAGSTIEQSEEAQAEAVASAEAGLKKEWGAAYEQNMAATDAVAAKLGIPDDVLVGLNKAMGGLEATKWVHALNAKIGEDTVDGGEGNVGDGLMTPQTAQTKLNELYGNKEFMDAWLDKQHPGHVDAVSKKERFSKMVTGTAP